VSVTGGALPEGVRLSVSSRRVGASSPGFGGTEVDSRGRFAIEGLMAGEYELSLRAYVPGVLAAQGPRFPTVRQTVSVLDTGEVSVTLVYDIGKTTEPTP
jgi:hypothetical protein